MQVDDADKPAEGSPEEKPDPRLATLIAGLPREMQPARDLWPGIAARLGTAPPAPAERNPPAWQPNPEGTTWWKLAAATVAGAAFGMLVTLLVLGGPTQGELTQGKLAKGGVQPQEVVPVGFGQQAQEAAPPDYRLVEADFLRAREALWLEVYSRRDRFSPDTLAAVEKSFASLDRAIQDLRKALEREPGNPRLEAELYRSHRRSLGLLRKLADET